MNSPLSVSRAAIHPGRQRSATPCAKRCSASRRSRIRQILHRRNRLNRCDRTACFTAIPSTARRSFDRKFTESLCCQESTVRQGSCFDSRTRCQRAAGRWRVGGPRRRARADSSCLHSAHRGQPASQTVNLVLEISASRQPFPPVPTVDARWQPAMPAGSTRSTAGCTRSLDGHRSGRTGRTRRFSRRSSRPSCPT